MAIDILAESTKRTPWGKMINVALGSDFYCCYNSGDENYGELIFHEPKHGLLMYAFSEGKKIHDLRIFGEVTNTTIEQVKKIPYIRYTKEGSNYIFFEADPKDSFEEFIQEFIPAFAFCNPWHENLDHVRLCSPQEVGRPGSTYPRLISGSKFSICGEEVAKMIPNYSKTNWYSYN